VLKNWLHKITHEFKVFNLKKDNRPVVFIICVFIASALWLAGNLGKKYETTVSVPIQYTNLPKNKVLINQPSSKVSLMVEGHGFTLLRHKIQLTINPINFNVNLFTSNMMEINESTTYTLDLKKYIPQISKQISADITIIDILPETIEFNFDQIVTQKKAVTHNFDIVFQNHYFLSAPIKFTPDSVLLTGPFKVVDTIQNIITRKLEFKGLNAPVRKRNVRLEDISHVEMQPTRVNVEIPVSLYTEYNAEVPIEKINVPDSLVIIALPSRVKVKCMVAVEQYANLNPRSFTFVIDYEKPDAATNKFNVELNRAPGYIQQLTFTPSQVDYLTQKKTQ
jgi:hypothetical protein